MHVKVIYYSIHFHIPSFFLQQCQIYEWLGRGIRTTIGWGSNDQVDDQAYIRSRWRRWYPRDCMNQEYNIDGGDFGFQTNSRWRLRLQSTARFYASSSFSSPSSSWLWSSVGLNFFFFPSSYVMIMIFSHVRWLLCLPHVDE